jgi:hypothetical protein
MNKLVTVLLALLALTPAFAQRETTSASAILQADFVGPAERVTSGELYNYLTDWMDGFMRQEGYSCAAHEVLVWEGENAVLGPELTFMGFQAGAGMANWEYLEFSNQVDGQGNTITYFGFLTASDVVMGLAVFRSPQLQVNLCAAEEL